MSPFAPVCASSSSSPPRWAVAVALAVLLAVSGVLRAEGPADKADAALKQLAARFDDPKADREQLRLDLLAFERTCLGTSPALRAAEMVMKLPSPLDQLDSRAIPAGERWTGQPKELVAVLGAHRPLSAGGFDQMAFSPDGKLFAARQVFNSSIRVWDATSLRRKVDIANPGDAAFSDRLTPPTFSPDDKTLAVVTTFGTVRRWDLATGEDKELFRLTKETSGIQAAAISMDCQAVALAYADGTVRLYDAARGEGAKETVLTGHREGIWKVAFSPDAKTLAVAYKDGAIGLWALSANPPTERVAVSKYSKEQAMTLAFARDGQTLAVGQIDGSVLRRDLSRPDLEEDWVPTGSTCGMLEEVLSPDCNALVQTYKDGMVRLWDVSGKEPEPDESQILAMGKRSGYFPWANSAAFSPDGKTLVTEGPRNVIRLWDLTATGPVERMPPQGYGAPVTTTGLSFDLATLVSGDADGNLRLWDLGGKAPKARTVMHGHKHRVTSVAFAPDKKSVVSFCQDRGERHGTVQRWDLSGAEPKEQTIPGLGEHITCLTLSPDGRTLASSGYEEPVRLWDLGAAEVKERAVIKAATNVSAMAFSPDGTALACGGNVCIDVWDLGGAEPKERNGPDRQKITDNLARAGRLADWDSLHIAYAPDGDGFAWARRGWALESVWHEHIFYKASEKDFKALPVLKRMSGNGEDGSANDCVAFGPDGKTAVSVFGDGHVDLWDPASGKVLRAWDLPFPTLCVTFAADGRHLIVGSADGAVYVLRLADPPKAAP